MAQCGHGLSEILQPDATFETQATDRRDYFLMGLRMYPKAAYLGP